MRKMNRTMIVTVEGDGIFPIDMLRYDRATPNTEIDSGKINDTKRRIVAVRMEGLPTVGRWESFGWKVIDARPYTYGD